MKVCIHILLVLASVANASKTDVTPVKKVLQLLQGMLEKGKKEKHEEQVTYAATKQFCDDEHVKLERQIKEETQTIEGLVAKISKGTADAAHLTKEISGLDEDEDTWSGDIKAATKVREIEKADYEKTHADYDESIDAMGRAISVLKKQTADRKQAGSLLQVSTSSMIPDYAKKAIEMFVQQGEDESVDSSAAPEANGYEFQSHGVIDMLTKLNDKFIDERTELEKAEVNSKHAYSLLMQDLKAQIAQAIKDEGAKKVSKSKKLASTADAKGDKKSEEGLKKTDSKSLKDLDADCAMKAQEFEARQNLRAGEIQAIEKAIEIISGAAVSGNADKHLPSSLLQKATSLGQLRSSNGNGEGNGNGLDSSVTMKVQLGVSQFLRAKAAQTNSRVLAAMAERIAADPYAKVKKMLKDLVVKLMEEANEEAEHKGWCDTELGTNAQTRKEKTQLVESLHSEIDSLQASISKLTEDISSLSKAIADVDSAVAAATKIRNEEKSKNKATISDAQDGQTAVAQALTVLREFYAKAAEASEASFLQYKGMQADSGGVVGMLEVIESDFARLESETSTAEGTAQKSYDESLVDSKEDKATKQATQEHKSGKLQDETQALTEKKSDLEGSQKELDAALKYYDKLKPSCVDSGVSYEDRVARRKEEIESMQEGLKILNGEELA